MIVLIQVFAVIILVAGIVFASYPDVMKRIIAYMGERRRFTYVGGLRVAVSVLLFLAASQCRHTAVIFLLGVVFLVSGIAAFSMSDEKIKSFITWYLGRPEVTLRLLALVPAVIGLILLLSA